MSTNNENIRGDNAGSGSAEQTGRAREAQQQIPNVPEEEKQQIALEVGEDATNVSTVSDMGGFSCRDDSAGGSGDRMEQQSTGDATDKP